MTGRRDLGPEAYMGVGFAQVLQKPFTKGELVATLKLMGIVAEEETKEPVSHTPPKTIVSEEKNTTPSLYNLDIIHSFLGRNEDAIFEVLTTFVSDTKTNMALLDQTVSYRDYPQVNQVAHRMLPMFRQLKVAKCVVVLEKLELAKADTMDWGGEMDESYDILKQQVKQLLTELEERLATSPNYSG